MHEFNLKTDKEGFYDITEKVSQAVAKSGKTDGICVVFCPHTTGGITINENDDPAVVKDLLYTLDKTFPESSDYGHMEGNSHAHMKTSCVGSSETIIIENGKLILGTWQSIYFCEFDGPRDRRFFVKII